MKESMELILIYREDLNRENANDWEEKQYRAHYIFYYDNMTYIWKSFNFEKTLAEIQEDYGITLRLIESSGSFIKWEVLEEVVIETVMEYPEAVKNNPNVIIMNNGNYVYGKVEKLGNIITIFYPNPNADIYVPLFDTIQDSISYLNSL